jgi:pectate lyase
MRRIARSIGILFFGFCIVAIILNVALPDGSRAAGEPAAIVMPDLRMLGENQAKDQLAALGVTNIWVDYQTRDRIPEVYDQYEPYVVLSTMPAAGEAIPPGETVVLGIRAPEASAAAEPVVETPASEQPAVSDPAVASEPTTADAPPMDTAATAAAEASIAPAADTFVKSNEPNTNFGAAGRLVVDAKPASTSLIRFEVAGIGQNAVRQARLRLFVTAADAPAGLKLFSADSGWDEMAVTWNKQPARGAQVAELAPAALSPGSWIDLNLGSAVTGDGTYSFALVTESTAGVSFRSSNKAEAPQLVLSLGSPALETAPTPATTSTPTTAPATPTTAPATPTATTAPTSVPATPTATAAPPPPSSGPAVAFPGAEGFGATTPGGRGGKLIYVTTLADSGVGSLRAALEASGPRTVLFNVAGTIVLNSDISIAQPFITVAGQSAPGEGVQIKGGMIKIKTHDVVLRYLKMRPGDGLNQSTITDRDALALAGNSDEVYNVVVDHCSMVWGPDIGGLSILTNAHDITVQNSIIGEGLYLSNHTEATVDQNGHALGLNITQLNTSAWPRRITLHHNLLTTADHRMPQVMGGEAIDIVNNVIYNWGTSAAHGNPRSLNLINNMFIKGPMTKSLLAWETRTNPENPTLWPASIYEQGNVAEGFSTIRGNPQTVYAATRFGSYSLRSEQAARDAYSFVVQNAGANRPVRDSADQRIVNNLTQRGGKFLNASDLAWPNLAAAPTPADADGDGMPDSWEQAQFGTVSRGTAASTSSDLDGDGYTDVEEYLNNTDPKVAGR